MAAGRAGAGRRFDQRAAHQSLASVEGVLNLRGLAEGAPLRGRDHPHESAVPFVLALVASACGDGCTISGRTVPFGLPPIRIFRRTMESGR